MVACLVEIFCLVFHGFYWSFVLIGLVAEGSVRDLSFGAFSRSFFYFWGAKLEFSWFCRLLSVVLGGCLWGYGIGFGPFFMGDVDLRVRAWTCPLCVHCSFDSH